MSNDGGTTAKIEQAMADVLAAMQQDNGDKLFKNADIWKYQTDVLNGGIEAFKKLTPFAFVKYSPPTESTREGDGDLNQILRFGIGIGQHSKEAGVARIGDDNHIGVSRFRDLVIAQFDRWHPGEEFDCDHFLYDGDEVHVDTPTEYGLVVYFKTNRITH